MNRVTFSTALADPPAVSAGAAIDPDDDGTQLAAAGLPRHWRGLLVPYDEAAPDGRIIGSPDGGTPRSRQMPQPLKAQIASAPEHDNAVLIGRVTRIWSQDGALWGEGDFDLGTEDGRDWAGRVARGMAGWGSVDLDAETAPVVSSQGENRPPLRRYNDWTFAGYTLVGRPAFDPARIEAVNGADEDTIDDEHNMRIPRQVEDDLDDVDDSYGADDGRDLENGINACGCHEATTAMAVSGDTDLPITDTSRMWDSADALRRVRAWAGVDAEAPTPAAWTRYARAFFWHEDNPTTFGAFKLPFADVISGRLTAVPRGIFAAAAAMQGARGGVDIPDADADAVRRRIGTYYQRMDRTAPWQTSSSADRNLLVAAGGITGLVTGYDAETGWLRIATGAEASIVCPADTVDDDGTALLAAGSAVSAPETIPDGWLQDPQLDSPTPLQVEDSGRVYGHLATWNTCHTAFSGTCVTPPRSATGYDYFHVGDVVTESGAHTPVGKLVIGGSHAGPYAGWRAATAHYDRDSATIALVRAGEDEHGIWVAGSLLPHIQPRQVAALRRSPLSGDWRRIGGNLELVAALAVSVPGFPIPRPRAATVRAQQTSLIAAGVLGQTIAPALDEIRLQALIEHAVDAVLSTRQQRQSRAAAALARIGTPPPATGDCTEGNK